MDEKDRLILKVLELDAHLSNRAVAAMVRLPTSTVNRRILKMEEDGVIKGYRLVLDYEKTGKPVGAYIFINEAEITRDLGHIPKSKIIDELRKFKEIQEVSDVQGANFDLVAKARTGSLKELSALTERLREIEGIEELFTAIIVEEVANL